VKRSGWDLAFGDLDLASARHRAICFPVRSVRYEGFVDVSGIVLSADGVVVQTLGCGARTRDRRTASARLVLQNCGRERVVFAQARSR